MGSIIFPPLLYHPHRLFSLPQCFPSPIKILHPAGNAHATTGGKTNPNSYILNDTLSLKDTRRQRGKKLEENANSHLRVVYSLLNYFLFYIFQISNNLDWYSFANQKQFLNVLKVNSLSRSCKSQIFPKHNPTFSPAGRCGSLTLHPPQEWLVLVSAHLTHS